MFLHATLTLLSLESWTVRKNGGMEVDSNKHNHNHNGNHNSNQDSNHNRNHDSNHHRNHHSNHHNSSNSNAAQLSRCWLDMRLFNFRPISWVWKAKWHVLLNEPIFLKHFRVVGGLWVGCHKCRGCLIDHTYFHCKLPASAMSGTSVVGPAGSAARFAVWGWAASPVIGIHSFFLLSKLLQPLIVCCISRLQTCTLLLYIIL